MEDACKKVLLDTSEDSELRILAFKVFAINPSHTKAAIIKNILDDKNCQLQSMFVIKCIFINILFHIYNIMDSTILYLFLLISV